MDQKDSSERSAPKPLIQLSARGSAVLPAPAESPPAPEPGLGKGNRFWSGEGVLSFRRHRWEENA